MSLFNDFRWIRKKKFLDRILKILCVVLVVYVINHLSMRHFYRLDLKKKQNFALEKTSLDILKQLHEPIEIFLFYGYSQSNEIPFFVNDLRNLLKEYKHAARNFIKVKFINIVEQPRMMEELSLRFGTMASDSVIISCRELFHVIPVFDLYEFKNGIVSGFCGEHVISNEISKLLGRNMKKVLFTSGHGEIDCDSTHPIYGCSSVKELLYQNGYQAEKIKLTECMIHKDVKLLILAGAQTKFTDDEIQILKTFLQQDGRILILLSSSKICGLEDLFFDWGILADDMLIFNKNNEHTGLLGDTIIDQFADHRITKSIIDRQLTVLLGLCQPVRIDIGSPATKQNKVTPLFSSGKYTFAKLDYLQQKSEYNPAEDLMGPIPVATLSEATVNENTAQCAGKLLVIGNASFISNNRFCVLGNKILFNSMVNWLLDDINEHTDNLKAKAIESYKITLSRSDFVEIMKFIFIIPILLFLCGHLVAFIRRTF